MAIFKTLQEGLLHLFFPHLCAGCGTDRLHTASCLCLRCVEAMPETVFERFPANPVEKTFWGRLPIAAATAQYYFTKESLMQGLLHQLKYKGHRDLGIQLGKMMGFQLQASGRFAADALIPLPLFAERERKRGYNQATVLCEGIASVMHLPVLTRAITRPMYTDTQTLKGRVERWKNIEGKFLLNQPELLSRQRIILVDDVVTTGATLESCGAELLKAPGVQLSIAALCYTAR